LKKLKFKKTDRFIELLNSLPPEIKKSFAKALKLMEKDLKHPSLHIEKIKGSNGYFGGGIFSIRITQKYRVTFEFLDENTILFRVIGSHDKVYKSP
jgi:mRNA-degrading endonuclease RelE of RelBE toxin-antitoxin system